MIQAQKNEIKSRLECKYLKLENEYRLLGYEKVKQLNTVGVEKLKMKK